LSCTEISSTVDDGDNVDDDNNVDEGDKVDECDNNDVGTDKGKVFDKFFLLILLSTTFVLSHFFFENPTLMTMLLYPFSDCMVLVAEFDVNSRKLCKPFTGVEKMLVKMLKAF
jgi:hypothetical protein